MSLDSGTQNLMLRTARIRRGEMLSHISDLDRSLSSIWAGRAQG